MTEQDTKTEAKPFQYVEEIHAAPSWTVEFFYPEPSADQREMGFTHGSTAVVAYDPAAAELIRAGAEIVEFLTDAHQDLARWGKSWSEHAPSTAAGFTLYAEHAADLLARLTRGAEDGAR